MRCLYFLSRSGAWLLLLGCVVTQTTPAEELTHPFRYVFVGTSDSCASAVAEAEALVNGGSADVTDNEIETSQLFSGAAAPAYCSTILPDSTPTPAVIAEQGWVPSGVGILPDIKNGDDPRCSTVEIESGSKKFSTSQIVNGLCAKEEVN